MIPLLTPRIQAPVTLDVRATSLTQALPRLGEAYGVPMRAAPAIGDEIVILSLRDVALDELKTRLAATFAAEWSVGADGTLTLNRAARLRNAEPRAFFARREQGARGLLDALRKAAAESPPITAELIEKYRRLMEEAKRTGKEPAASPGPEPIMPGRRLLAGLAAGLRPTDLTGLTSRTVYSSAPTPVQRPFPLAVAPLVAAYEREQALVRRFTEAENANDDPSGSGAPIATLQLVVESNVEAVSIEMRGFDAAGRSTVTEGEETAFYTEDGPTARESGAVAGAAVAIAAEAPQPAAPDAHVFPVSEESRAYVDALGSGTTFASIAQLAKDRERVRPFLDPVTRDPLSYTLSDVAFEAARWTGRSVVVRPGDDEIFAGTIVESDRPLPLPTAFALRKIDLATPGWLIARPEYPYAIGLGFFPRPALRDALAAAFADGRLSIATATRIAALAPETGTEAPLLSLPNRLAYGRTFLYMPALRILAEMGETGRKRAEGGVRLGTLSTSLRQRVEAMVFGPSAILIRRNAPQAGFAFAAAPDLEAEPTSLLPNGLSAETRVTVTTTNVDGVVPVEASLQNGRTIAPDLLAQYVFQNRNPRLFSSGVSQQSARWSVARLRRAGRETTTLRIDLTPNHLVTYSYQSYDAPTGPEFTLSSLPTDLRAAVDRAMPGVEARFRDAKPYEAEPSDGAPPP